MLRRTSVAFASLGLLIALPAHAQAVEGQDESSSGADQSNGIQDIVVTASRRAVNVQRESRQLSAVGGDELSRNGVADPAALANLVPGLTIGRSGPQFQIYIRGVGDRSVNAFGDPAVAPSLDGVYIPRSFTIPGLFFDLERVEVVKGPQGTLYGRNATAGAMNLISARPTEALGGFVEMEAGNLQAMRAAAAVSGAIAPNLSVRASGQVTTRDGYLSDGLSDEKMQSARLQLMFQPSDKFSLRVGATYAHQGGTGAAPVLLPQVDSSRSFVGAADPASIARFNLLNPSNSLFRPGTDVYLDTDSWVLSATAEWRPIDGIVLTVLPGYVHGTNRNRNYVPGIPYDQVQTSNQKSIEARLSSDGSSALQWVLGGYYSKEKSTDWSQFAINRAVQIRRNFPTLDDETWAVFGEGKLSLTDRLRAIGGVRYTYETKKIDGTSQTIVGGNPTPAGRIFGDTSFDAVNYRAGVEYDAADRVMLYATVSTGFKAGGFFGALPPNTYKPERLTSYEAGVKSRFFDNHLQVNVDAFWWDYTDRQESYIGIVTGGATANITTNAGSARIRGVDASIMALLTDNDRLTFDAEYLDSKYIDFVYDTNTTAARTGCRLGAPSDPRLSASVDCSGFQLVRAPKWSGRVSFQHNFPLADGSRVSLLAQTRFSSPYWLAPDFIPVERTKSYHVSDVSLAYLTAGERLDVSAYVRNIENKEVYTLGAQSSGIDGLVLATTQLPRTYGVRLRYKY
ncbi:TonB-dependent receptor [Sphingobium sp. SYK-6]|uniref:TonB-dependent receptor n=1 Tax=Sphingobium sp. (strain NBRC 103272 / SYK-6) TaxID=627192 RepID=UPI0002FDDFF3|nr:TonB-dependent receptor [Sphingobium sp. SYK-6]